MSYDIGMLVWAKMKGYPPWPGKIVEANSSIKAPKKEKAHFIYFFGTKNHAYILDKNIIPHSDDMYANVSTKKKSKSYQLAIDELMSSSKEKIKESSKMKGNCTKKKSYKGVKKLKGGKSNADASDVVSNEVEDKMLPEPNEKRKNIRKVKIIQSTPQKRVKHVLTQESVPDTNKILDFSKSDKLENLCHNRKFVKKEQSPSIFSVDTDVSSSSRSNQSEALVVDIETLDPVIHPDKKIGFIGLNLNDLGKVIFKKITACGMSVTVWDKNMDEYEEFVAASGAKCAASPAELIVDCDITFCYCDTDTDIFKDIIFGEHGVLKGFEEAEKLGQKQKGYVGLNSIDEDTSKAINDALTLKYRGLYLEAPVICTNEKDRDYTLVVVASGDRQLFTTCEEGFFRIIAKKSLFISCEVNLSSKMKVVFNAFSATMHTAMNETMVLSDRLGLSTSDVQQVSEQMFKKRQNDSNGRLFDCALRMSKNNFTPHNTLKNVQKDIDISLTLANGISHVMPVAAAANEVYKRAKLLNYSDCDAIAVYKVIKY